ncbi:MAG: dihydrolipoamide acetyltransferase family protein [Malacoplasma sp.]
MYKFKFADIGEGIHEGKVGEIFVKEGQPIKDGENLFIVETDKVTTEITSPTNGTISKILIKTGSTVHVGDEIFYIDDGVSNESQKETTSDKTITKKEESNGEEGGASVVGEVVVSNKLLQNFGNQNKSVNVDKPSNKNVLISPVARLMAIENKIDLSTLAGSGPFGRILRQDVENNISTPKSSVNRSFDSNRKDVILPISQLRNTIAKALKESTTNVSYTNLTLKIDVTELWTLRTKVKDEILAKHNVKLTLLPFIVKAIALSIHEHPLFNAIYDSEKHQIIQKGNINIGIAIDTKDGLIVPNIKNVDSLSIIDIAKEISSLAKKTRDKKIEMKDLKDGTFSITNYGSLGASFGTPIIKYPELAIAGIGTLENVISKIDNNFVERSVFHLTIAADHRWIDGGDIARFGQTIKKYLENILLIWL